MVLRAASQSGRGGPRWASDPLYGDSGHEQALAPLLVLLLVWMIGGALAGSVVLLCLALEAIEDRSNCLLARGVASGDVMELLGGSRALMS